MLTRLWLTTELGARVLRGTIEVHMKRIPDALERRSKGSAHNRRHIKRPREVFYSRAGGGAKTSQGFSRLGQLGADRVYADVDLGNGLNVEVVLCQNSALLK